MSIVLLGPLLAALITGFASRWRRLTAVLGLLAAIVLWLLLRAEPAISQSVVLLSRALVLTPGLRALFLFLYAGLAGLFALAILFPQGGKLIPASLAAYGFLAAALMIRPSLFGVLFLVMALGLLALAVQDDRAGAVQGGVRYLALAVLSLPFLLAATWLADTQATAAGGIVARTVVWGGLILLAAFPFHVWATTVVREASPLVWLLLFGLVQFVVMRFVFGLVADGLDGEMVRLVELASALTLLVALLLLLTAVTLNRVVGGLLLADMTCVVLLLGQSPAVNWETAVIVQMARFFSVGVLAVGLLLWTRFGGGALTLAGEVGEQPRCLGIARRAPLSMLVLLFGCLSLAGLPLTIGFGGRWLAISLLAAKGANMLALLLLATTGAGVLVLLRALPYWFALPDEAQHQPGEGRWLQVLLAGGLLLALWLAWQPQVWLAYAVRLAGLFAG